MNIDGSSRNMTDAKMKKAPQYQFGIEVGLIIELCIEHGCCLFGYTVLYSDSIVMIVGECISYLCGFLKAWLLD